VTRRTKRILGSLLVLVLCLGAAAFVGLRARDAEQVAVGEPELASASVDGFETAQAAPSIAAPTPTSSPRSKHRVRAKAVKAKPAAPAVAARRARANKPAATAARPSRSSVKKGASIFGKPRGLTKALGDSGVSWMYNWSASPNGARAKGVEFVPMIWGAAAADQATLNRAKKNSTVLLGFNEPDFKDQSNLSVDAALDLWPKLEATGLRLGGPAVAAGANQEGQWLDLFMDGAKQRGYRVDFIPLHWYGADFDPTRATSQLRSYIESTHAKYHKPIWVTEYALINFAGSPRLPTPKVQAEFVKKSTAMLERLSYVERYAWFAFPTSTDGTDGTGLYRPGGLPTVPGKAYRVAGR
jgi:putative glycosyl hydrolase